MFVKTSDLLVEEQLNGGSLRCNYQGHIKHHHKGAVDGFRALCWIVRIVCSVLMMMLFSNATYAQESIPETVERHDQEIKRLSEEVDKLNKILRQRKEEPNLPSYIIPPAPHFPYKSCNFTGAEVFIGDKQIMVEAGPVKIPDVGTKTPPYFVTAKFECEGIPITCRGRGILDMQLNASFGINVVMEYFPDGSCEAQLVLPKETILKP